MASRTDARLNAILRPALEELDASWLALTLERFPHWRQLGDQLPLVMSVGGLLLEGMAYLFAKPPPETSRIFGQRSQRPSTILHLMTAPVTSLQPDMSRNKLKML